VVLIWIRIKNKNVPIYALALPRHEIHSSANLPEVGGRRIRQGSILSLMKDSDLHRISYTEGRVKSYQHSISVRRGAERKV